MRKFSFCGLDYSRRYIQKKFNELIIYSTFVKRLSGRGFLNVLDCGCGYGRFSQCISNFISYKRLFLLDISEKGVRKAKRILSKNNTTFFVTADAEGLPFKKEIFDLVLLIEVLSYTDDPAKVIKELRRVMVKKAILIVSVENRQGAIICDQYLKKEDLKKVLLNGEREDVKYFVEREFFEVLKEGGFSILHSEKIGYTYAGVFERFLKGRNKLTKEEILELEDICKKQKEFSNVARAICVLAEKR